MSAPRTSFPCAPFKPDTVAASRESASQSTNILDNDNNNKDCEELDFDLPSLDAALPSPSMSTTEHQSECLTTETTKDEGHEVKSETGSDVVMSPAWGVLLISAQSCGPVAEEAEGQQLWGDTMYGIRGHTYLVDSSPDDATEASFNWERFFAALRDNTLPNVDIVGVAH